MNLLLFASNLKEPKNSHIYTSYKKNILMYVYTLCMYLY